MAITTRRRALALTGALGLGAWSQRALAQDAPAAAPSPLTPRVRRNVKDLVSNDADLEAYRLAISKMRASGAWKRQVDYHADMSFRHHSSWRFLPWHRLQLLHMEKIVAHLSGKDDFAMPYWDWADDTIPAAFTDDDVLTLKGRECGNTESIATFLKANDAYLADRSRNDFGTFFGKARAADQPTDRDSGHQYFSGSAEWGGHNLIHSFVGGDMGVLETSPNDPLFWLHHSNVDRAWVAWAQRHSDGDYAPEWRMEELKGYEDPDGSNPAPVAASTMVDNELLGFTYDTGLQVMAGAAAPLGAARRLRQPRVVEYTFEMTRQGPSKGVIRIPPAAAAAHSAQAVGYLKIDPDPTHASATRIRCTDLTDGSTAFDDKVFLVPMGMKMGLQGYRIDLSALWRGADDKGLSLSAETGPLVGRKAGPHPPAIASFVVDAKATFYD
jgi:hypothetical protein